ncbi:peptide chain release factor family protein [Schlesneria sp. T3-172]|uniref:peptide chain release factor family protein n=1 Tax=Schlesneria sphaerica TaxID=3373610 RepID=UPI0037C694CD
MLEIDPPDLEHPARIPVETLLRDCDVRHERRRGPGGQHRNKTESAVVIRHRPTGIEGQAAERRSQFDNHRNAVKRLRLNLALAVRTHALAEAAPTELWRSRCAGGRIGINEEHEDFPQVLAEALDVLNARNSHLHGSAEQLGCTPSQLIKLLKKEPRAFLWLNESRRRHGLSQLD